MLPPIARLRDFLGVSQRELAHLLNVSHSLLAKIEDGTRNTPPLLDAQLAQWMLALDLAETELPAMPQRKMEMPHERQKLQQAIALYKKEAHYLAARLEEQRLKLAERTQQWQRWQALSAVAPGFPAVDLNGLALLANRKDVRYTGWTATHLAVQEARWEQLQALVGALEKLAAGLEAAEAPG